MTFAINDVSCDFAGEECERVARYVLIRPERLYPPFPLCPSCARTIETKMRLEGLADWSLETLHQFNGTVTVTVEPRTRPVDHP